jgi:hypothetical protein
MRADLKPMPAKLDDVYDGLKPMEHLGAVRENVAPLEPAIVSVREAVDELEPARAVAGGRGRGRRAGARDPHAPWLSP